MSHGLVNVNNFGLIVLYMQIFFTQDFVHHTNRLTAGDPMAEDTTVGATITTAHADKVCNSCYLMHTIIFCRTVIHLGVGKSVTYRNASASNELQHKDFYEI